MKRIVYRLTEEEAAVIDKMRKDARDKKKPEPPQCLYMWKQQRCLARSKRDGYCLNHWNMLERRKEEHGE